MGRRAKDTRSGWKDKDRLAKLKDKRVSEMAGLNRAPSEKAKLENLKIASQQAANCSAKDSNWGDSLNTTAASEMSVATRTRNTKPSSDVVNKARDINN